MTATLPSDARRVARGGHTACARTATSAHPLKDFAALALRAEAASMNPPNEADMAQSLPWKPWHDVVSLREDVRTGELSLADFAADLHDVAMQKGARPVYEDPARFFALTYPTFPLRELARDVALRLAGRNTKAIRQLELTYGGGKTHTLVTLYHLVHAPDALPALPAIEQFRSHIGAPLPTARVAALCFDKLDVEKGMEVRGPDGALRWLKHPWSVLAFQLAGDEGLGTLHPDGANEERETPPAEPLLADLLSQPQAHGLATLVLIDEVLMYAREKAAMGDVWRARLIDFFQYLCQAAVRVDRCALVASLLASDPAKSDALGKELTAQIFDIFNRQREEGVQPVQKQDVAEVLRRRFFTPQSIADPDVFRPHVTAAVANIAGVDETVRKDRANAEQRFLDGYPFHPELTELFYTKWTQLDGFQRTRGILRTFAIALRDAEAWDTAPLVGPNVFLPAPDESALAEAARELAGTATREVTESAGNVWSAVLEGELAKARTIQEEQPALKFREMEQAVLAAFLSSQPIGQKASTPELVALVGATRPDRIELEKGLRRWTELSWFLDEAEFAGTAAADGGPGALPGAWRLGNRPNLKQMHHDACANRVTAELVEQTLLADVRRTKSLTQGAAAPGARVHTLPERPRDIEDDGDFHFAILGPKAVSDSGKPNAEVRRFIDETTGPDRPRTGRNAVVLVAPSTGRPGRRPRAHPRISGLGGRAPTVGGPDPGPGARGNARRLDGAGAQARPRRDPPGLVDRRHRQRAQRHPGVQGDRGRRPAVRDGQGGPARAHSGDRHQRRCDAAGRPLRSLARGRTLAPREGPGRRVRGESEAAEDAPAQGDPRHHRPGRPRRHLRRLARPARQSPSGPGGGRRSTRQPARSLPSNSSCPTRRRCRNSIRTLWRRVSCRSCGPSEAVTVADVVAYFAGGRVVTVQREGYTEPVAIPACAREAVESAIADAVYQGLLWLANGPASFQGEIVPPGVLTDAAALRAPMPPLVVERLTQDAVPEAWKDGRTNALALSAALAVQVGSPLPWPILRRAIGDALDARWLELAPDSGPWPCDAAGAAAVTLKQPDAGTGLVAREESRRVDSERRTHQRRRPGTQRAAELWSTSCRRSSLPPPASRCRFHIRITLGDGGDVPPESVSSISELLEGVSADLRLTGESTSRPEGSR